MIHLLCLTRFQLILPLFYKKSDRSQDARRGSPDIPNGPSDQSFQNMCDMQKLINWPGKLILCNKKKHLRIAYFGGHESGLPDFGRSWTPNDWHKVNFRPTPENFRTDSISWNLVVYKHLGTNRFFVTSRADCCEAFECFKRSWRRVWFGFGTPVGLSFKNRLALNMMPDMPILGDISESCVYLFWKPLVVICFDLFAGHEPFSFFFF